MTAKSFTTLLQDLPKKKDCCDIIQVQKNTLRKYEETNEMLRNFLELSENTHTILLEKFNTHSKTLTTLKKDLQVCFKRIRTLKTKLQAKYPEAFEATADAIKELQERYELDEDDDDYRPPSSSAENTREEIKTLSESMVGEKDNGSSTQNDTLTSTDENKTSHYENITSVAENSELKDDCSTVKDSQGEIGSVVDADCPSVINSPSLSNNTVLTNEEDKTGNSDLG